MFGKKGSKILKLPPVRNCFTLAMTNKLVVIINSLKVPKIKKILLYKMEFLVPNYSCLQNPPTRGLPPPDPRSLCPLSATLFFETPPTLNKIPGYATESVVILLLFIRLLQAVVPPSLILSDFFHSSVHNVLFLGTYLKLNLFLNSALFKINKNLIIVSWCT